MWKQGDSQTDVQASATFKRRKIRRGVAQPVDESYCFRRHGIEAPNKRPVHESLRCDDDVDTAAKQPSRSAQLPGSSKLTQTYLDLGQKNFFPIRCPSCGFVYTPGKRQDEKLHEEYHRGSSVLKYHSCKDDVEIFKDGKAGRILRVHWDRLSTSMTDLAATIEKELGLMPNWLFKVQCSVFIYVTSMREILGCVLTENIRRAWTATTSHITTERQQGTNAIDNGIVLVDKHKQNKALWGIRIMWTSPAARRKGIATKLLDCARSQLARGCLLPRDALAFSQPTAEGAAFIRSYTGSSEFMVYEA